jgi:DNA-3-methyladenine glycosylase II
MSATPSSTGGVGRSTRRGGSCGGPADVAPKPGQATKTKDQPTWRKTRFAQSGGSRPMGEPERCAEARQRSVTVKIDRSPVCTQAQTFEGHRLEIEPRGPFRLDLTAWALRRRSHNTVDRWETATYERVVSLAGGPVALSVTQVAGPDAPRLSVLLAGRHIEQRAEALARDTVNRLLGLSVDLSPFAAMAAPDPLLGPLAARLRGLKPPRFPTVFEALVNGVACQQLSLAVGIHLLNRLAADRGKATSDALDSPHAFPDPEDLASLQPDELKRHGFSATKARAIIETARSVTAGDLDLEELQRLEDGAAIERLTSLRGIGRWTAEYVLLRGLGRLHVFPGDDVGAHNKLRRLFAIETPLDYEAVGRLVARWHPYAGVVYFHLLLDSLSRARGHVAR